MELQTETTRDMSNVFAKNKFNIGEIGETSNKI